MAKYKLEYIWLDGYEPVANLRGKTLVKEFDSFPKLEELPCGALTAVRPGRPKGTVPTACSNPWPSYPDPTKKNGVLVMCEVMLPDGKPASDQRPRHHPRRSRTPGSASSRNIFSTRTAPRSASPNGGFPPRRANITPASATTTWAIIAREIVDTHLDLCLDCGINHEGINAEVAKGQWEFQIFGKGSKNAADQMWMARYLLMRLCEKYRWT